MAEGDSGTMDMMAGAADVLQGALQGIQGVLDGIFQLMAKLFNAIIDSSPLLQGVLKIVDKMFKLVLMPIGNLIGKILMPIAINMAKKTMNMMSKFGNAGPSSISDMMAEGMDIASSALAEMVGAVLFKVLPPIFGGLLKALPVAIYNGLLGIFKNLPGIGRFFQGAGEIPFVDTMSSAFEDLKSTLFGEINESPLLESIKGIEQATDQFGMTIQTANTLLTGTVATEADNTLNVFDDGATTIGMGFGNLNNGVMSGANESATIMYAGAADIASGFQSVTDAIAVGTANALVEMDTEFNGFNAGMMEKLDTVKEPFDETVRVFGEGIGEFVKTMVERNDDMDKNIKKSKGLIERLMELFGGLLAWLAEAVGNLAGGIGDALGGAGEFVGDMVTGAGNIIGNVASGASEFVGGIGNSLGNLFKFADGGIATGPVRGVFGEAGDEAVIPLTGASGNAAFRSWMGPLNDTLKNMSDSIGSNARQAPMEVRFEINGDVYGMADLESKIERVVSKYGSRLRGSY